MALSFSASRALLRSARAGRTQCRIFAHNRTFTAGVNLFVEDDKLSRVQRKELDDRKTSEMASVDYFAAKEQKTKESFRQALELFNNRDIRRRGAVEFIQAALKNMKAFGVHRDLETYKAILEVLPKGKYVPSNKWQVAFKHYPKQQNCGIDILKQMNENEVVPDEHMGELINVIFGPESDPMKKYKRLMYWLPKFKNLSPWPIPYDLPKDTRELAKLAINQITSIDRLTDVVEYETELLEESSDKTWIVSGQSPMQRGMIKDLDKKKALYVEGAFRVWLYNQQVNYFILRGDPIPRPPPPEAEVDDFKKENVKMWMFGEHHPSDGVHIPNMHEQVDATILACCATGTSSKDSLLSWVRFLQRENPELKDVPILFTLTSPLGPVVPLSEEEISGKKEMF